MTTPEPAACCGPTCCATETPEPAPSAETIRATVRETYAALAAASAESECGCGPTCCGEGGVTDMIGDAYATVDGYTTTGDLKLGCGVPTEHAGLEPGQTILDLGSGAGLDLFIARSIVGEHGYLIGVDMTPAMVDRARANAADLGYSNVEFRLGEIEHLPVRDASVDVVLSNCVLNLVPDKAAAFAEMHRVLKPGAHFCISDIVVQGTLPPSIQHSIELHAGCVAGAIEQTAYLDLLYDAGFTDVEIVASRPIDVPDEALPDSVDLEEVRAFRASGNALLSITVRGTRSLA
ncbi:MAG: arsenite methyltransferase [Rhodothermales bacterium]